MVSAFFQLLREPETLRSAEEACRAVHPLTEPVDGLPSANSALRSFLPKPVSLWIASGGVLQANAALSSFVSLAPTPGGLDALENGKERRCMRW